MSKPSSENAHLAGMLLIAMPAMTDPRFTRSVVYLCAHSPEGAMGLIVNQVADEVGFSAVVEQLGIEAGPEAAAQRVHVGGPVESSRGFVLHSPDYRHESTLVIDEEFALTATVDVLKAIAGGNGPKHSVFALGYAGWAPGQLDAEIQANGWLVAPAESALVYDADNESKWLRAMRTIGVDPALLSTTTGHA
ncbi:YqgE/AlgH family protein [Geminicoccaceae bacterium 1502E]|nr:YqgE/AlgH family protein [Geminicoccaceae bacterium 1502E]